MKLNIIFLISLLTNFTLGKNVIKCSKTEIGNVNYECKNNLETLDYKNNDSIAKNGEIIKANAEIREKRSPAKGKKHGKNNKKAIGNKKGKKPKKAGKIKNGKENKCTNQFVKYEEKNKNKSKTGGEHKKGGKIKGKKNPKKGKNKNKKLNKKKKSKTSGKRTKRQVDPRAEIIPMGHPKYVPNAHTIKYGPFDVQEFTGNREQRLISERFIKKSFKDHYGATVELKTEDRTIDKTDYLIKLHNIIRDLNEDQVLIDLYQNHNQRKIYIYITFYFDGRVDFNGYGLDQGMYKKNRVENERIFFEIPTLLQGVLA